MRFRNTKYSFEKLNRQQPQSDENRVTCQGIRNIENKQIQPSTIVVTRYDVSFMKSQVNFSQCKDIVCQIDGAGNTSVLYNTTGYFEAILMRFSEQCKTGQSYMTFPVVPTGVKTIGPQHNTLDMYIDRFVQSMPGQQGKLQNVNTV